MGYVELGLTPERREEINRGFDLVPEGSYDLRIGPYKMANTRAGDPQAKYTIEVVDVVDGDREAIGMKFPHGCTLVPGKEFSTVRLGEAAERQAGVEAIVGTGFDKDAVVGLTLRGRVSHRKDGDRTFHDITWA